MIGVFSASEAPLTRPPRENLLPHANRSRYGACQLSIPHVSYSWVIVKRGRARRAGYSTGPGFDPRRPLAPVLILLGAFVTMFTIIFQYGFFSPVEIITVKLFGFALAGVMVGWGVSTFWGAMHEG